MSAAQKYPSPCSHLSPYPLPRYLSVSSARADGTAPYAAAPPQTFIKGLFFHDILLKRSSRRWKKRKQMRWKWQRKKLKKLKRKRRASQK